MFWTEASARIGKNNLDAGAITYKMYDACGTGDHRQYVRVSEFQVIAWYLLPRAWHRVGSLRQREQCDTHRCDRAHDTGFPLLIIDISTLVVGSQMPKLPRVATAVACVLAIAPSQIANAIVDMKNANYSFTWFDSVAHPGARSAKLYRTYNSRSLYDGNFGFGWCTDFETRLDVLFDTIRVVECGGGLEVFYALPSSPPLAVTIAKILNFWAQKDRLPTDDRAAFQEQLQSDPVLRDRMGVQSRTYQPQAAGHAEREA